MNALGLALMVALAAPLLPANAASPPPPKGSAANKEALELEKARMEVEQAKAKADEARALVLKAEAEKAKAEADAGRAKADALRPSPDYLKAEFERTKYFWDLGSHALMLLIAVGFVVWALPKLSEITISLFGGTLSAKLGEKLPPASPPPPPSPARESAAGPQAHALMEAASQRAQPVPESLLGLAEEDDIYQAVKVDRHTIYLSHRARRVPRSEYSRIKMYIDADHPSTLEKVERVTYRLHPTFTPREVTVKERAEAFSYEVTAWGEFMLYAQVYFKGQERPVLLTRYLNL